MSAPIEPDHHEAMNLIAKNLDDQLNPLRHMTGKRQTGFMLTVFDFDSADGRFNYISNADKLDVRRMLQDVLARLDDRAGQDTEHMTVVARADLDRLRSLIAEARAALLTIANAPAWGAPDRWETTPSELRQYAREAAAKIEVNGK